MKKFGFLILIIIFSSVSFAQTNSETSNKIAVINSDAFFDESTGIIEVVIGKRKLAKEFESYNKEIYEIVEEYNKQRIVILKFNEFMKNNKNFPCDYESITKKIDNLESLAKRIKEKVSEIKLLYKKRETELLGSKFENIKRELKNFAKEKNYKEIFDIAGNYEIFELSNYKTINEATISASEKLDVTKDFIFYYNSAPKPK